MTDFFREEASRRAGDNLHGTVLVQSPISWPLIAGIVSISLLTVLVILGVATYPVTATASGILRTESGVLRVVAPRAGRIETVACRNGDAVAEDQRLITVVSSDIGLSGIPMDATIAASIDHQEERLAAQIEAINQRYASESQSARAEASALEAEIAGYNEREPELIHLVEIAEEDFTRAEEIAARGFLSRRDLATRQETLYRRRETLAQMRGERRSRIAQLAQISADLNAANALRNAELNQLATTQAGLSQARAEYDLNRGYVLTAARPGIVGNLDLRVGDYVAVGQPILTIAPEQGAIIAEINLDDRLATSVEAEQAVRIELNSFPADRYGFLTGTIARVSYTPTPAGDGEADVEAVTYKAVASIDLVNVPERLAQLRLVDGMPFQARINLERPSLIARILNPRLWFSSL